MTNVYLKFRIFQLINVRSTSAFKLMFFLLIESDNHSQIIITWVVLINLFLFELSFILVICRKFEIHVGTCSCVVTVLLTNRLKMQTKRTPVRNSAEH